MVAWGLVKRWWKGDGEDGGVLAKGGGEWRREGMFAGGEA